MRTLLLATLLACVSALSGCSFGQPKPDANYAAYLDLYAKEQQAEQDQRTAFAQMAQKCTSDACVTQVAAIAALSQGGSNARAGAPQPFVQQESPWLKFGVALLSQTAPLATAVVGYEQSRMNRDVSLAQYGFLGNVVHDVSTTAASVAPTINVGGNYVTGTYDTGTHIGTYNTGLLNTGTIDRYNSPSNDPSASGNGCAGSTTCQSSSTITNPPPTTPPKTGP
ncbi:MAG TPA: hypothetical protein VFB54_03565 [Burkholderiales bacterium]|nr:hypothetical protein [Burkholderiales bacterium]